MLEEHGLTCRFALFPILWGHWQYRLGVRVIELAVLWSASAVGSADRLHHPLLGQEAEVVFEELGSERGKMPREVAGAFSTSIMSGGAERGHLRSRTGWMRASLGGAPLSPNFAAAIREPVPYLLGPLDSYYGATKPGQYVRRDEAQAAGYRPAAGKYCG
jgi:hypothetical protein